MITGGVVSTTVIVRIPFDVFPASSVAVQIRVMIFNSGHTPRVSVSVKIIGIIPSTLSSAVTSAGRGTPSPSTVISRGIPDKTGGWTS